MAKTKKFDSVRLMRDLRDKINKEILGMNPEQIIEYFRKAREQYEQEMAVK